MVAPVPASPVVLQQAEIASDDALQRDAETSAAEKDTAQMAIEASPSSMFSPWPDRLRHAAIILLVAGLALAALVFFGELTPLRAGIVFACIAGAALVPWRLHNSDAKRDEALVNPV